MKKFTVDDCLVIDIETNSLEAPTSVHCVVVSTLDGIVETFVKPSSNAVELGRLMDRLRSHPGFFTGHNIINFDAPVLRDFFPELKDIVTDERCLDTLVLSRLFYYGREGGHSLRQWGDNLKIKKEFADPPANFFDEFSEELLARCVSDVKINVAIVKRLSRYITDPDWAAAIDTEHRTASECRLMHETGLPFNKEAADRLHRELTERIAPIDGIIQRDFPPQLVEIKRFTPSLTKTGTIAVKDFRWASIYDWTLDGTQVILRHRRDNPVVPDLSGFTVGVEYTLSEFIPFNPGSPKQVVARLNEFGWKPTEKTKGHIDSLKRGSAVSKERLEEFKRTGWKVSEENLRTLPSSAPEGAFKLAERIVLSSRIADIVEWLSAHKDGKLHPTYTSIGAWTHRLSHSKPNCANIPKSKPSSTDTEFDKYINSVNDEMRALFWAPKGFRLIGTDADGIQMRIFAHYCNDQRLIDALVKGKKEDGTDIHSLHKGFLGEVCGSRDVAKTFIYAFLLGAGVGKVAEILSCSGADAKRAVDNFLDAYPGLRELKKRQIPEWAERKYFVGLDGRKVFCDSEHLMLSGMLQNGEKVIMARSMNQWLDKLRSEKIDFQLVNWVHDEWQTLIPDDDDLCSYVQKVQIQSIRDQSEQLGMACPTEGSSDWGYTWKETH